MYNKVFKYFFVLVFLFVSGTAFAAIGKVTISSPADGAMVASKDAIKLNYEADPGSSGDHLHLTVDGSMVEIIKPLKGVAEVAPLTSGKHKICLVVNTKKHSPTGAQSCVNVVSE